MKRSEVINVLAKQFIDRGMVGELMAPIAAREILDILELLGMCPPEHLFTSGEKADHYLQEWESEQGPVIKWMK